ncbi:MAG: GntR family transcriptional regulator [Planctomycetota bacterium]
MMNFSVDPESHVPLHSQVEQLLRTMLRDPGYRSGKLLPPETKLASELCVSRNTVRASIDRLVNQGLLTRKPGRGTWATPSGKRASRLESWESFTREMAAQGIEVQDFQQRYGLRAAPAPVADAFGVQRNTRVFALERVRGFDGKRIAHFLSWFHPRLELSGDEDFASPLYVVLEERCGVRAECSRERIVAVPADKGLAEKLEVEAGTPLLRRVRRVSDAGDRLIEYAVNHYRSDQFEYTIDIKRGDG